MNAFRQLCEQRRGDLHIQQMLHGLGGIASGCIRYGIGRGNIGLDVIDRGAVEQIDAGDQQSDLRRIRKDRLQLHAGKSERIRPERGARRKDTDSRIAAEPRGTHRRRPALSGRLLCGVKAPDQPDMRKSGQAAHGIAPAVFRYKDDLAPDRGCQSALPRQSEFFGEAGADVCDRGERKLSRR